MGRFTILRVSLLLLCLVAVSVQGSVVIEYPMGSTIEYEREIGPIEYEASSLVDIYVENVPDPLRWKDWLIEIWLPAGTAPADLIMNVDYDNTQDHSAPIEVFPVTLADHPGPSLWPDFLPVGFYASTWEAQWEDDGTVPEDETGDHPYGNPMWVSFHLDLPDGPFGLHIYDECIPEPATLGLLLLGGLALFSYRRSA